MNDYPTDEELEKLREWDHRDAKGALDFLRAHWNVNYGSVSTELSAAENKVLHASEGERFLRLATGGWSGNEDLMAAMRQNVVIWSRVWQLHGVGGLWILRYPQE